MTEELCKKLENYNEESSTLEDIKIFEEMLNVQVKVFGAENFNSIIYCGEEREKKIYLYKNGNHFDVINSMKAFWEAVITAKNATKFITTKIGIDVAKTPIFAISAKTLIIQAKMKIKYIAKIATDTALIKTASITTVIFARKLTNARIVIRFY